MKKRILAMVLALCMVLSIIPAVSAAEVASGTCGDNLTWVLTDDGTLTISGKGEMDSYQHLTGAPWRDHVVTAIIEPGVTNISSNAFTCCKQLKQVSIPDTVTKIGFNSFAYCDSLAEVVIPDSVTEISDEAFYKSTGLVSVKLSKNLTELESSMFEGCSSLVSIDIPASVRSIWSRVFCYCKSLSSVTFHEGLEDIGCDAFTGCSKLAEVDLPKSLNSICRFAFDGTAWSKKLSGYEIVGNQVLFGYFGDELLEGAVRLPDGVLSTAGYAFRYDEWDTCGKLTSVVLPESIRTIAFNSFSNQKFDRITFPANVQEIESEAFSECYNLNTIYFTGNAPHISSDAFYDTDQMKAYYPADKNWSADDFKDYGSDGIEWIGYHSFSDVPSGGFFYEPVVWASTNNITNGTSATAFSPDAPCNRAAVVTFLWRAAGEPNPKSTSHPFVDVEKGSFYEKAVLWAVENGITNGVDATHFGPTASCNRAQVVTFLYRAQNNPAFTNKDCPFTDVTAGQWYEAPILWAVEKGVTNGMGDGTFGVNGICNRAQVVTFLYRAYVN